MAIMNPNPDEPCPPPVEKVAVEPKGYRGVTVDTKKNERSTLTTYLEGQAWAVDYYSRVHGQNTGSGALQVGLNGVYQQYKLIRGFEFKVTSPLTPEQNDNKEMSLTGSANIYSVLIPNEGDMFIADVGDGQEGLFQVITSRRKTIYMETAHEIDYKMISYNSAATAKDLAGKVVETVFFSQDYLKTGYNPLLKVEVVDLIGRLEAHYARLIALYFNDFYSREHKTLIVPNQDRITYDPFLVRFLSEIISTDEHPYVRHVAELNVSNDQAMYEFTLWNCIARMDPDLLPMAAQEMEIVGTRQFFSLPMFNSIYYSRIERVIYPIQYPTNVDAGYREAADPHTTPIVNSTGRFRELKRMIRQTQLITDTAEGPYVPMDGLDCPEVKPVTEDSYYVFTKRFYDFDAREGELSLLENMTRQALNGEKIDLKILDKLCSGSRFWDNLERFYYIPILFALLRTYPRGL